MPVQGFAGQIRTAAEQTATKRCRSFAGIMSRNCSVGKVPATLLIAKLTRSDPLTINGCRLIAAQVDAIETIFALPSGNLSEEKLAAWIRGNCQNPKPGSPRGHK
jgi:hypothetical protein